MASITATYAGILALLYVLLSARVIRARREAKVSLGAGESAPLQRAIRVHGNFAEYVPLALILMLLAEFGGTSAWLLNVIGLALLIGRSVHAYGVSQSDENHRLRVAGMALTFGAIAIAALRCLAGAVLGSA